MTSIELHKNNNGKLGTYSKVSIKNKMDLSLAYTPGVADVSKLLAENPEKAREYSLKGNTVAIVSDGSAVLGLGNIGAFGAIPVMEGKAAIAKEFASVDAFPICLKTQEVDEVVNIVKNISPVFGLINLEDISAPRCFDILERLNNELDVPVMHDDQQGTAVVVLAALINSLKLKNLSVENVKIVISGAGAAGYCVLKLLLKYGFKDIIVTDSLGIICKGREGVVGYKEDICQNTNWSSLKGDLSKAIEGRDVFIGLSAPNILTKEMVQSMNSNPVVFALSNPTPEIMPDLAKEAGAFIVATGRSDYPNQVNNSLAFPGMFKGILKYDVKKLTEEMLIKAAKSIAFLHEPTVEKIVPDMFDERLVDVVSESFSED